MNETAKGFLESILRHVLTAVATLLATKGVIDATQQVSLVETSVAFVLAILAMGWSYFSKKSATTKLEKAIAAPAGQAE